MSIFSTILIIFYSLSSNLSGDEVSLTGGFYPYETYYIGSIDLETGSTDIPIFSFLLSAPNFNEPYCPKIIFNATFTITILSPELGFDDETTMIHLEATGIEMEHPIYLENKDFNKDTDHIVDTQGNVIDFNIGDDFEVFDLEESTNLLNAIVSMGRLPDGIYKFVIEYSDFKRDNIDDCPQEDFDQDNIIRTEIINITTPTSLNLIYPGGSLPDTSQNIVYTPYPVFQWSTETCTSCELFIRVAEFNPESHSSLDESIDDVTSLPINQLDGWEKVEGVTSFSYPVIGARELEEGKLYAWQIKKELPSTLGTDSYLSPISVFKLADPSATNQDDISTSTQITADPILISLKDLFGEDTFNAYFVDDGDLANYIPIGAYRINNESTTSNDILQILDQLQQGSISVVSINVE